MRQSMARRISLKRPKLGELDALREEIEKAKARGADEEVTRLTLLLGARRAAQQDHPLHRPARRALSPIRARAEAEYRSGHVLSDGRVGLDDRGNERPCQAILHAAARLPDAPLPACRRGVHPPHLDRRRGRRGNILLQPRNRRHRGLDRAGKDARDRPRALLARSLEHLRRAGLGRRQLRRGQQPLRVAARRPGVAALPVFRLCRGRRRHQRQPDRVVARQRFVARL